MTDHKFKRSPKPVEPRLEDFGTSKDLEEALEGPYKVIGILLKWSLGLVAVATLALLVYVFSYAGRSRDSVR